MAVRPIDANALHAEIGKWPEPVMYKDWVQSAIATAPTLTPPNEPTCPCDLCEYNPPSSLDGKPCCMCPADCRPPEGEENDV